VVAVFMILLAATYLPSSVPEERDSNPSPSTGFLANVGQLSNDAVRLYRPSAAMQVGFADGAVLYRVLPPPATTIQARAEFGVDSLSGVIVRTAFRGGDSVAPAGRGELSARANYFLGDDPSRWRTHVPSYAEVVYADVWPGVSIVYRAAPDGVKYSYELRAGASPDSIALEYEGADGMGIAEGGLVVVTAAGELRDSPPTAEQDGRPVACAFRMIAASIVGLECPGWDPARPGVIDPLVWVTYVGASGRDDLRSVAVDDAGFVYVTGHTGSTDFPVTPGAFNMTYGGGFFDVFVAKFQPGGDQLVWATYLGGLAEEYALSIDIDGSGSAYVTGYTTSTDFPTQGALDPDWNGTDAFVAKLSPSGDTLVYSTFLGGTGEDAGEAIAVGSDGSAFLVGITTSTDFPTTVGAPNRTHNGGFTDAFVAKLDPAGMSLAYATYLGGTQLETAVAIAIDGAGAAYVTGGTLSTDFLTTPGAYDRFYNDLGPIPAGDAFLTKVNALGTGYVYSTFVGGAAADSAWGVRVDGVGRAYIAGYTESPNFPTTVGAMNSTYIGGGDAFVSALSPAGDALALSTFLGGTAVDQAFALQLDALGRPFVAGSTTSTDFPVTPDAPNGTRSGGRDAFVVYLNASLDTMRFGTFFGGSGNDDLYALAIDLYGHAYLGGLTLSTDLPTTAGAFDRTCGTDGACDFDGIQSYSDGFLAKVKVTNPVTRNITILTIPSSLQVQIDGLPFTSPHIFACVLGTVHTLDAPSPQVAGSTRYLFDGWSDAGTQNHAIDCVADATIAALFLTEHEVVVATAPPGLTIVVDLTPITAPGTYWWLEGSFHVLDAVSPQGSGGTRETFFVWSDGGARAHVIAVAGPQTYVASFLTEHNVTVSADPIGTRIEVDAVSVITPFSFWCLAGTTHTLNATSPQVSGPTRRLFRMWSDAGAQNHTFLCSAPAAFTASFDTEYEVIVDTSPLLLQVIVDGLPSTAPWTFWCAANSTHTLNAATPQGTGLTRYAFASWSDGLPRFHSVTCTAPTAYLATFDTEHWIDLDTRPDGLLVTVDGGTTSAPAGVWWLEGSSHDLDVPTPQFGNATRYTFAAWLDGSGRARTVVVTGPARYVARFDVEYSVTLVTDPPGLQLLIDGVLVATPFSTWWLNGSLHSVSAPSPQIGAPGVQFVFDVWDDGGAQVRQIQTDGPVALTASFLTQYRLSLSSSHGMPTCDVVDCWYAPGDTASFDIEGITNATAVTRYAFDRWSGDVSQTEANGSIVMDGPKYAAATWRTQHFLRVDSAFGTPTGEGWYAEGRIATFSVSPKDVVSGGRRFHFSRWTGDVASNAASASVLMDGPRVVTAVWEEPSDWWWFFLPLAVVAFLILFFLAKRRKEAEDEGTPPSPSSGPRARLAAFVTAIRTRIRLRR
jgi:hypothetical protein